GLDVEAERQLDGFAGRARRRDDDDAAARAASAEKRLAVRRQVRVADRTLRRRLVYDVGSGRRTGGGVFSEESGRARGGVARSRAGLGVRVVVSRRVGRGLLRKPEVSTSRSDGPKITVPFAGFWRSAVWQSV